MAKEMVSKKTWEEFRGSGLLWWTNRILHTFGWSIVIELDDNDDDNDDEKIVNVYPARVKFRGFDDEAETRGFKRLSKYMVDNAEELNKEAES